MQDPVGCYVHIPFCVRKCAYCDFNSYSGYTDSLVARYVAALHAEIRAEKPIGPVDTIFFGGGTPTAIPAEDEAALLKSVLETLPVTPDAEITTEANPNSADVEGLEILRRAGFNRISFGVQSFDSNLLKTMDRLHSADEAKAAVHAARAAGFENVSIDLMFGLPRQTMAQWKYTLAQAFALGTDHISLYNLIVEEGTGFATLARKGRLPLPTDDLAAEMYQVAIDSATEAGYGQYEISNFAKPGRECRHNLHYWRNDSYHGLGAGAVAYRNHTRRTNILRPKPYAEAALRGSDLTHEATVADGCDQRAETMMMGLRLTKDGVSDELFTRRFGLGLRAAYGCEIERFMGLGLLEWSGANLRLTPRGVFLANDVMAAFL